MCTGEKLIPYTQNEKLLLASLIDKHKNVIENKKTDSSTIQRKQQEWDIVADEYNCQANLITTRRTATQLKKLWSNLKQRKRKATTELKYNRLLTGAGPEPPEDLDPVMEAVDVAAPHADVSLSCPWDSTAIYEKKTAEQFASPAGIVQGSSNKMIAMTSEVSENENTSAADLFLPKSSSGSVSANNPANVHLLEAPANERKTTVAVVQIEANMRVQKMREAIKQQEELHEVRMQIENEQLQVILATRKKIEAEEELAALQLKLFKEKHNL